MKSFERAVKVTRGGLIESVHDAAIAVARPDGQIVAHLGEPDLAILLRSAAKPFQAAAVVASGAVRMYGLTAGELALMAGSHAGEEGHVAAAASILRKVALDPSALQCGVHVPFSSKAAARLARNGGAPGVLMNNCSGKHAGMLAAARVGGHPIDTYLDPVHPVQLANLGCICRFTGGAAHEIATAVDGCGVPTFAVSLRGAARAYAQLIASREDGGGNDPLVRGLAEVAWAMRKHPEMVAGDGMLDTELMRAVPGLIAKVGADGVHAMGWLGSKGPLGAALKLMDGSDGRPRTAVVVSLLRALGALDGIPGLPEAVTGSLTVRNHLHLEVGEVSAVFTLRSPAP